MPVLEWTSGRPTRITLGTKVINLQWDDSEQMTKISLEFTRNMLSMYDLLFSLESIKKHKDKKRKNKEKKQLLW